MYVIKMMTGALSLFLKYFIGYIFKTVVHLSIRGLIKFVIEAPAFYVFLVFLRN